MQRTVLHDDACHRSFPFIQTSFDNRTFCLSVRVGFQFLHFRHKIDGVKQVVDAHTRFRGNGNDHYVAAPLFGNEIVFHKPLFHLIGVHVRLIHLVHRYDNRHVCGFRVVDGFHRLRHNSVVCRNN